MFEKRFWGVLLVLLMMFAVSGSVLAQKFDPINPVAKFPPVNLLPAEFQKEAKSVERAYKSLLKAKEESAKALERLKEKFKNGQPVEVRFYLRLYDRADIQHRRYWEEMLFRMFDALNVGDALLFQEYAPGQFRVSDDQIEQYEKWTYFVYEAWHRTAPPAEMKKEDAEFLQKARDMAHPEHLFSPG